MNVKFPGMKLQFYGKNLQSAGNNLKGQEENLQILGDGLIILGIIRKPDIRGADFAKYRYPSTGSVDIPGAG